VIPVPETGSSWPESCENIGRETVSIEADAGEACFAALTICCTQLEA
jgi:hypothetical protein